MHVRVSRAHRRAEPVRQLFEHELALRARWWQDIQGISGPSAHRRGAGEGDAGRRFANWQWPTSRRAANWGACERDTSWWGACGTAADGWRGGGLPRGSWRGKRGLGEASRRAGASLPTDARHS